MYQVSDDHVWGKDFEARSLLVMGLSGSDKTAEILGMFNRFNENTVLMPDGKSARFARGVLETQGTRKDLGRKTRRALGFPL